MTIETPKVLRLPGFADADEVLSWHRRLLDSIEFVFRRVRTDFEQGNAMHKIVTSAPNAADLEEGEIVFMDDESGTERLYTKLNGTVRYVALT